MSAYQAGRPRVSSTMTKHNPRPRKYASASERQAAYRARAPEVCFRAEAKTVQTLDDIADTLDQSRADLLLSMTKFALANHDWARFGLTHKPLPYGYGVQERADNPAPIWKRARPKSLGKPVPLTAKQKAAAKKRAAAAGRPYPNLVDNIAASRLENPTVKKPTPAQLAARARFAEMARSGAFKRKAKTKRKTNPVEGAKFQVGKYYETRFIGDVNLKIGATILARTDKTVKVKGTSGMKSSYRLTKDYKGNEIFYPMGRYSMAPIISADDEGRKANPAKKTVSQKISQLVHEGYPQKQAVAVALSEQRAGKVKATPRKRKTNPMPNQVTETIYQQLGGNRFAMMTGAKNFVAYPDLLEFSIPRNASSANRVRVFYEPGTDLYTLTFNRTSVTAGGVKSTEVARFNDVYADQLQPLFTEVTSMYTSLGTMGRKTNPRASNPATGQKGSRTKRNPIGSSRVKYVCIAPLEYSGAKYGIDERTPVTMKFTKTEPAAHRVHACYQLPSRLVQSDDFQNFAYHNKVIYMSLAELKMLLKGYMK